MQLVIDALRSSRAFGALNLVNTTNAKTLHSAFLRALLTIIASGVDSLSTLIIGLQVSFFRLGPVVTRFKRKTPRWPPRSKCAYRHISI
jgi:hypothetical protein